MLTLLHPKTVQVRVRGVTNTRNETLHGRLKTELAAIVDTLPEPTTRLNADNNRALWESWRSGLTVKPTRSTELPPLRLLLVMDNLVGHKNSAWLVWCFQQGILPLYTPVAGSWRIWRNPCNASSMGGSGACTRHPVARRLNNGAAHTT